ncbi:MAG: DUF4351 domain-containing protein [Crinalium sp.]
MQESVIYQDIFQKGFQQGLQQGRLVVIMRHINRRFGGVNPDIQQRLQKLSIPQLDDLGEALLDFSQPNDLTRWLEEQGF